MERKEYEVAGVRVLAQRSPGGAFYEIEVMETGETMRYLAEVFESVAREVTKPSESAREVL